MPATPATFVWYELMTTDLDAAAAFYGSVVGWGRQDWGPPGGYALMKAGEAMVAGIMPMPDEYRESGGPPAWLGYIGVENVDAATEELRQAGGTVHRAPADIPEIGRFSVVADPHGAMFMLFTPQGGAPPTAAPMTPGHVGWHELHAGDGPAAFDFYAARFGWTKDQAMDMGPMGTYQLFAAGGPAIGGIMTKPAQMPRPAWLFYFTVPAIDAAQKRVSDGGGQVLNGPMEVPGGAWIIQCLDPQGAMFALVAAGR